MTTHVASCCPVVAHSLLCACVVCACVCMQPVDGTLVDWYFVEGSLQSVNRDAITSKNHAIYNQRMVVVFDSPLVGRFVFVGVGALCVGSVTIEAPAGVGSVQVGAQYTRGDELGFFQFGGSTVVLLFEAGRTRMDDALALTSSSAVETKVQVRARIGLAISNNTNVGLTPT